MPIYEYACEKCGEFEVSQRITDEPLKKCPTCRRKVRKLISNTSFQLKGSGWYVTDYARKGKDGGKESGKDTGAGGEKATKSDAAAAPSGESKGGGESKSGGEAKPSAGGEGKSKSAKSPKASSAKAA